MQKIRWILCVSLLAGIPTLVFSQTTLGDKRGEEDAPVKSMRAHKPTREKPVKIRRPKVQHTPEYEFYARVEQVARDKQRMLRKMDAPQYYNPMYFGHKRPPKRHEPHKMRYCKECGLRH